MRLNINLTYKEQIVQTTIINVYQVETSSPPRTIDITDTIDRFCEVERRRALPAEHHREDLDLPKPTG